MENFNDFFKTENDTKDTESLLNKYLYRNVKKEVQGMKPLTKVPLPFDSINRILEGGLEEEKLWVIGGLPGTGKTTFVNQVIEAMSHQYPTMTISLEMSNRVSVPMIERRKQRNEDNFYAVYDITSIDEIENLIGAFKSVHHGEVFIAIDYLQKIKNESASDDKSKLDNNITRLKDLTKKYSGMRILLISSMNSDAFGGSMRQGVMSGSRAIEYEVDITSAFVYVNDEGKIISDISNFDEENGKKLKRGLYFVKNRQGNIHTKAVFNYDRNLGILTDERAYVPPIEVEYDTSSMGAFL